METADHPLVTWELAFPVGVFLLLCAIAFAVYRYHTRNRANDPVSEDATRELYDHPDTYDEHKQALDHRLGPDDGKAP